MLDLGCLYGEMTIRLWDLLEKRQRSAPFVIGLDISSKCLRRSWPGPAYVCGDGESLPLASKSLDAVVMTGLLEHVRDDARVVSEAERVSRKQIIVATPFLYADEDLQHVRLWDWRRFSGRAGFRFFASLFHEGGAGDLCCTWDVDR